jgi:hypothetical protein
VSGDEALATLADEIDALADRLADRALELLSAAVRADDPEVARTERVVTRARRSLEKAAGLLRGADADGGA